MVAEAGKELSFVVCAAHAIYQKSQGPRKRAFWYGGYKGEDSQYARHLEDSHNIVAKYPYKCLILSGGDTRRFQLLKDTINAAKKGEEPPRVTTFVEANGLLDLGKETGRFREASPEERRSLVDAGAREEDIEYVMDGKAGKGTPIIMERFARDSFENLIFSVLAYRRFWGEAPKGLIGVVSWPFKSLRYYYSALRLGIENFQFYGSGKLDYDKVKNSSDGEIDYLMEARKDPTHRGAGFVRKRLERTVKDPADADMEKEYADYWQRVFDHYGVDPEVRTMLEDLRSAEAPLPSRFEYRRDFGV